MDSEKEIPGVYLTFVCWSCGESRGAIFSREPEFAFEVAAMATDVGMKGYVDQRYGRSLVFCNDECANNQTTATGYFRQRPKKLVGSVAP